MRVLTLSLAVALVAAGTAHAAVDRIVSDTDLKQFNQLIEQNGGQWQAKRTPQSQMSRAEIGRLLGSNTRPHSTLDFDGFSSGAQTKLDWRDKDGINWLGPVMNQGNCGSCVAFATVATLEAQVAITSGLPWLRPSFSPQQLFGCGGGGCEFGWFPDSAAGFLKRDGIVDAACAPYTSGSTGDDVACGQQTCADAKSRSYRILGDTTPGGSIETVKAALKKGPMVTVMDVYADFLAYSGGIYKSVSNDNVGGHAVSLVGYDDASRTWLIRNSWGPTWGENGFARISWDDKSGIGSDNWQFNVQKDDSYLSVSSPMDRDFVTGTKSIFVASGGKNGAAGVSVQIRSDRSGVSRQLACTPDTKDGATGCTANLDTTTLDDGRYEVTASVGKATATLFSQPREFFVINHEPTDLAISFTGAGVDLAKPIKGRIELNVTTSSKPLPLHSITFYARQGGKVYQQRTTDVVLPQMKLGFRTTTIPNGKYEILFRGEMPYAGKVVTVESAPMTVTVAN